LDLQGLCTSQENTEKGTRSLIRRPFWCSEVVAHTGGGGSTASMPDRWFLILGGPNPKLRGSNLRQPGLTSRGGGGQIAQWPMHNFIQTVRIDMTFHPCSMAPDGGLLAGSCLVGNFAHAGRSTPRRWDPIPKPQLPTHHMFSLDVVSSGQVQPHIRSRSRAIRSRL